MHYTTISNDVNRELHDYKRGRNNLDERSLETIELELAFMVRRIVAISSDKTVGTLDRSAYLLLHHITAHGSAGVKALADKFHLDISTASRQAAALEQKGYVSRVPDPLDGRACSLRITEPGMQALIAYKQAKQARIKELLHEWSDEECFTFGKLLQKFNQTLG
jgi:DNA-binding MarR family transcriptional regulator